jgi:hypothetical protein
MTNERRSEFPVHLTLTIIASVSGVYMSISSIIIGHYVFSGPVASPKKMWGHQTRVFKPR